MIFQLTMFTVVVMFVHFCVSQYFFVLFRVILCLLVAHNPPLLDYFCTFTLKGAEYKSQSVYLDVPISCLRGENVNFCQVFAENQSTSATPLFVRCFFFLGGGGGINNRLALEK